MSLVVLIRVYGLFYEFTILCIENFRDPKRLGEDPWKFRRFRVDNRRRKSQKSRLTDPGVSRLPEPLREGSV